MKICVECKFIVPNTYSEMVNHTCAHQDCRHPVSGSRQKCIDMRKPRMPCAPEGKLHVEK